MKQTFGFAACDGRGLRLLLAESHVIVQLCMHTVIIGTDMRPRRVRTHEAGEEDETMVSRTGTSKVTFVIHFHSTRALYSDI
jgi:hypothetical protein